MLRTISLTANRGITLLVCIAILASSMPVTSFAQPRQAASPAPAVPNSSVTAPQPQPSEKSASGALRWEPSDAGDPESLPEKLGVRPGLSAPRPAMPGGQTLPAPRRQANSEVDPRAALPDFAWPAQSSQAKQPDPFANLAAQARAEPEQKTAVTALAQPQTSNPTVIKQDLASSSNANLAIYLPIILYNDGRNVPIMPEGGGVLDWDEGIQITFATGAVDAPAFARYDYATPRNLPSGLQPMGRSFDLSVKRQANNTSIAHFALQVMTATTVYNPEFNVWQTIYAVTPTVDIVVSYQQADIAGLQENRLRLYWQDPATRAWKAMPTLVDAEHHRVQATIARSGRYVLLGHPIAGSFPLGHGGLTAAQTLTATNPLVILDPDHGGGDPNGGYVNYPPQFAAYEEEYNLQVALLVRDRLQACGAQVEMTREGDYYVTLPDRANMINNSAPAAAATLAFDIVNHFMGDNTTTGTGVAAWVDFGKPIQSAFGLQMTSRVNEYTGLRNRGLKDGGRIYVVANVSGDITFTHAELAFMDNYFDRAIMDDPAGMGAIANGASRAIVDAMGGTEVCSGGGGFQFPEPLSPEERARLYKLGLKNWQRYRGDPASTSTGNSIQQFTDINAPGMGGFDFQLARVHNGLDSRDGLFGVGWSSLLDTYLRLARDGSVDVRLPDGAGVYFEAAGDGFVTGQDGVFYTLARNGPDFVLSSPDQVFYHFTIVSTTAQLTDIRDRHDNIITFERDANDRITSVVDSAGRAFAIGYDENHIASITDPLGRAISYGYNGSNDLTSVTDANGGTRQFEYDNHRMTKLTDPEGILYLQNIYDAEGRVIEQVDDKGSHNYFDFDTEGQTTFTDNLGNQTTDKYDDLGRVTETVDAMTESEEFVYDDDYNVTSYTDKRGNTWDYTYDERGNLLTETDPQGHGKTYTYNETNDLTSVTDEGGPGGALRTTTFVYDGEGNLVRIEQPDSTAIRSTYDSHGQLLTLADANDHTTTYVYDGQGNLIEVIDPEQNHTYYQYDAMGRMTAITDANNHTARFGYDNNDNIIRITDPKEKAITFEYDGNDLLKRMVDRRGGVTTYEYDTSLKLTDETDPEGHTTNHEYDAMYNRTRTIDPRGNKTIYRYNANYWLTEVENALGGVTHFGYDENGNLTSVTNALEYETTFEYDSLNQLVKQTDALGGITTNEYDAVGRLTATVAPNGARVEYTYDLLDRLTMVLDALDGEWTMAYDDAGNVIGTTDANGHTTVFYYDDADRLIERGDPGGHSTWFEYDGVGNTTQVTDALGRVTHYTYDENDNLETVTDALEGLTQLAYDEEDNLIAITDANTHTTRFKYDLDGLLVKLTEAGGQVTTYDYDEAHNLVKLTNAKGNAWTFAYDALNRRIRETDPLTHSTGYDYDLLDRLIRVTDANNIKTRYDYDELDRLVAVIQNEQPGQPDDYQTNVTTLYTYDAVGNLKTITDANGETTAFEYDLRNRLTQETNPLEHIWKYDYDPVDNLTRRTDAKSQVTNYVYDPDDLLTDILYPDNTGIYFDYDAVHNQTVMTDTLHYQIEMSGPSVTRNEFDALNRLTASIGPVSKSMSDTHGLMSNRVGYTYDPVGNRTSMTYPDGKVVSYEYDPTNFVKRVIDPDGGFFDVTRDLTHNIVRVDNPNNTWTEYDIDAAERLTAVRNLTGQNPHETISSFAYTLDPVGNRLGVDGVYRWRQPTQLDYDYVYDPLYRLTRSTDSEQHFTNYTYDAVGNRTQRVTNDDPTLKREIDVVTTTYSYDAANELTTSVREIAPRTNPDRALQTAQLLRAFVHEVEAQSGKHIDPATATDLTAQANTLIAGLESSQPPSIEDTAAALAALQTAVETAGAEGRIDREGIVNSLLVKIRHAGEANQERGGDVKATLYDYDLNGNRIRRTQPDIDTGNESDWLMTTYTYTFENLLTHIQDYRTPGSPDGNHWLPGDETFVYFDGYGRVFRRQHDQHIGGGGDQEWVDYVYDGLDPIVEYDNPDPQYVNYYRGLGRILEMRQNAGGGVGMGEVYYFHPDGLGGVSSITKQIGQSVHNYRYHDYGIILDINGKAADASNFTDPHNHYTYTGQEWDEHIDLFHFYAREYEPETGVWLQQDSYRGQLSAPQTLHRYGYAENNPVSLIDLLGYTIEEEAQGDVKVVKIVIDVSREEADVYLENGKVVTVPIAYGDDSYTSGTMYIAWWDKDFTSNTFENTREPWSTATDNWNPFGPYHATIGKHYPWKGTYDEENPGDMNLHGTVGPMEGGIKYLTQNGSRNLSHGCIRFLNKDIAYLFRNAPNGTPVEFRYNSPRPIQPTPTQSQNQLTPTNTSNNNQNTPGLFQNLMDMFTKFWKSIFG